MRNFNFLTSSYYQYVIAFFDYLTKASNKTFGAPKSDALSFPRVRLLEVEYTIRVSLSAGSLGSDIHVVLPVRIINFLSVDPPPSSPLSFPRATSEQSTIRRSDPGRGSTTGRSSVTEQRVLIGTNGDFAGAPYSYHDVDNTPRMSDLHYCASTRSVSVYEDSSSMDEEMLNNLVRPYRDDGYGAGTQPRRQDGGYNRPQFNGDFQDLRNPGQSDFPSAVRPQGPRQPSFPPSRRQDPQGATSFELRVQEKMRVSAPNHAQSGGIATKETNTSPYDRLSERLKFSGSTIHIEPPRAPNMTLNPSGIPCSLVPSHQLPKPPPMVSKPVLKMNLTDPGPVPFVNRSVNDPSAAVFKNQSDNGIPSASRMRSHTQSIRRPPLPLPNGSGSSVKSRIADMEDKVQELHLRTDGVTPFY